MIQARYPAWSADLLCPCLALAAPSTRSRSTRFTTTCSALHVRCHSSRSRYRTLRIARSTRPAPGCRERAEGKRRRNRFVVHHFVQQLGMTRLRGSRRPLDPGPISDAPVPRQTFRSSEVARAHWSRESPLQVPRFRNRGVPVSSTGMSNGNPNQAAGCLTR